MLKRAWKVLGNIAKYRRGNKTAFLGGVGAGMAYWLKRPLWVVRMVLFFLLLLFSRETLILYILLWIFAPQWKEDPLDFEKVTSSD